MNLDPSDLLELRTMVGRGGLLLSAVVHTADRPQSDSMLSCTTANDADSALGQKAASASRLHLSIHHLPLEAMMLLSPVSSMAGIVGLATQTIGMRHCQTAAIVHQYVAV